MDRRLLADVSGRWEDDFDSSICGFAPGLGSESYMFWCHSWNVLGLELCTIGCIDLRFVLF